MTITVATSTPETLDDDTETQTQQYYKAIKSGKRKGNNRKSKFIKNQLLHINPAVIMALLLFSLFLLALSLLLHHPTFAGSGEYLYTGKDQKEGDGANGKNYVHPIIDYVKPKKKTLESEAAYKDRLIHPTFLSDSYERPRVVEFYAPWCGHCIHFRSHYIELGKQTQEINPNVDFYAISCTVHNELCHKNGIRGYPTLKFYSEYNSTGIPIDRFSLNVNKLIENYVSKYSTFVLSINAQKDKNNVSERSNEVNSFQKQSVGEKTNFLHPDQHDIYINAASSLQFALRTSIFMTDEPLSAKQYNTLKDWLRLLSLTLPRSIGHRESEKSLSQVDSLLAKIDYVSRSEQNLNEVLSQKSNLKQREEWTVSCSKGVESAGYTCGLWHLLHIITIGLVHYNVDHTPTLTTMNTADMIRNYIEEYFTCDECRLNFIKMYEECRFERCNRLTMDAGSLDDWKQLSLWLWEVHNDVNVRLLYEERDRNGELLTDSEKETVIWPSKKDCPLCWQDGGGWNEDNVYKYLESFYW